MKHLRTTVTISIILLSTAMAWASGPTRSNKILQDDSIFQSRGTNATDLAQFGISTIWYKRLEYSPSIGFNFTSNPSFFDNALFTPAFGGAVALPLTASFGVKLAILYSQDEYSGEESIDAQPTSYLNRLSFIEIPIMLRIKPVTDFDGDILAGGVLELSIGNSYSYNNASGPKVPNTKPSGSAFGYTFGIEYVVYQITGTFRVTGGVPDNGNLPSPKTLVGQFLIAYTFVTAQ